jgi:hypothetical protein
MAWQAFESELHVEPYLTDRPTPRLEQLSERVLQGVLQSDAPSGMPERAVPTKTVTRQSRMSEHQPANDS